MKNPRQNKKSRTMNNAETPKRADRQPTMREIRSQSPVERQQYLNSMVATIERKYPEMDPGALRSMAFFLTEITPIVRPSGVEGAMRDHLIAWTTNHEYRNQMTYSVDEAGNLFVVITATPGYDDMPGILLQSHMDMNCNPTAKQNPEISPETNPVIPVFKKNETVVATEGTTLGADDGLGMATEVVLADEILHDLKLPHGKIGLLFTTDEEVGLTGAEGFSFPKDLLQGYKYFFNLDNEDSHEAIIGAAGGRNLDIRLPLERDQAARDQKYMTIDLSGLMGGHSGAEIHLGRLNAIKVMDTLVTACTGTLDDMRLVSIASGTTDSAIPQRARAVVAIKPGEEDLLQTVLLQTQEQIMQKDKQTKVSLAGSPIVKDKERRKGKLANETPEINLSETSGEMLELQPLTAASTRTVLSLLKDIPTGPLDIDTTYHIVKTSTNVGILDTVSENGGDFMRISSLTRSSSEEAMIQTNEMLRAIALAHGAIVEPGEKKFASWEPDFTDTLLVTARQTHKQSTGKDLDVTVIHAGLESHTIYLKIQKILKEDMPEDFHIISLGPSLDDPHSESEHFNIAEAGEFFPAMRLLLHTVLKNEIQERNSHESPRKGIPQAA